MSRSNYSRLALDLPQSFFRQKMNDKKVHRLKYNPDDYKGIDDYMWNVEEKYADYLKDKNIFSETALKQSFFI